MPDYEVEITIWSNGRRLAEVGVGPYSDLHQLDIGLSTALSTAAYKAYEIAASDSDA